MRDVCVSFFYVLRIWRLTGLNLLSNELTLQLDTRCRSIICGFVFTETVKESKIRIMRENITCFELVKHYKGSLENVANGNVYAHTKIPLGLSMPYSP